MRQVSSIIKPSEVRSRGTVALDLSAQNSKSIHSSRREPTVHCRPHRAHYSLCSPHGALCSGRSPRNPLSTAAPKEPTAFSLSAVPTMPHRAHCSLHSPHRALSSLQCAQSPLLSPQTPRSPQLSAVPTIRCKLHC